MRIKALMVFLVVILFNSCSVDDESLTSADVCATVLCAEAKQSFKLKFVDKNTEADLLFGSIISGTKYNVGQVKIYSTRFKKDLDFRIDSANKSNRFIVFSTAVTDEFIIGLANLSTDKLSAETQFIDQPCCDELKLTRLTLNSTSLSFAQFIPTTIILKK